MTFKTIPLVKNRIDGYSDFLKIRKEKNGVYGAALGISHSKDIWICGVFPMPSISKKLLDEEIRELIKNPNRVVLPWLYIYAGETKEMEELEVLKEKGYNNFLISGKDFGIFSAYSYTLEPLIIEDTIPQEIFEECIQYVSDFYTVFQK